MFLLYPVVLSLRLSALASLVFLAKEEGIVRFREMNHTHSTLRWVCNKGLFFGVAESAPHPTSYGVFILMFYMSS